MPRYRVRIAGKHYAAMADLVRKHRLNIAGHTGKRAGRRRYGVDAFADSDQIERLKSEGYSVDVLEDVHEAGKKRQSEIRSLTTRELARNVATANHYLNVPDIENSLAAAATGSNAGFTRLIKLPNKTWEGRECHAIKIGQGSVTSRPGIYFLGGIHARDGAARASLFISSSRLAKRNGRKAALRWAGLISLREKIQKLVNRRMVS